MYVHPDRVSVQNKTYVTKYSGMTRIYNRIISPQFDVSLISDLQYFLGNQLLIQLGEKVDNELEICELHTHLPTAVIDQFLREVSTYASNLLSIIKSSISPEVVIEFSIHKDDLIIQSVQLTIL